MKIGRGSIFKRPDSPYWWVKWYRDGKPFRESSNSTRKADAQALLHKRLGDVARGAPVSPRYDRLTFGEAARDVVNDYQTNGKRSLPDVVHRIGKHLLPYFGGRRMAMITSSDVREYILRRQTETTVVQKAHTVTSRNGRQRQVPEVRRTNVTVSSGEINRELTVLKRSFNLAIQAGKLLHKPHIPMLKECNVRTGFFSADDVKAVLANLPEDLRPVIQFAYITGWRIQSEVLTLQWHQVNFETGEVRLLAGTTKNGEGRLFPMTPGLRLLLKVQHERTRALTLERGRICPWVFHRSGAAIGSMRKAFASACIAAGCPGRIPHDLRRTAVRNMVRAGVPERVAMQLTGHKTRSVFERYNVTSPGDLENAVRLLDSFANGHVSGTLSSASAAERTSAS